MHVSIFMQLIAILLWQILLIAFDIRYVLRAQLRFNLFLNALILLDQQLIVAYSRSPVLICSILLNKILEEPLLLLTLSSLLFYRLKCQVLLLLNKLFQKHLL